MKFSIAVAALGALSVVACAQDQSQHDQAKSRRLESVTWNSVNHQLTWVVSNGEKEAANGAYKPDHQQSYLIDMDKATMTYNGETRRFSAEEAKRVHTLMDLIAKYAVESTVWWEEGQGIKLKNGDGDDDDSAPTTKAAYVAARQAPPVMLTALLQALSAPAPAKK